MVIALWLSPGHPPCGCVPQSPVSALCWGEAPCNGKGDGPVTCSHLGWMDLCRETLTHSIPNPAQTSISALTALSLPSREAGQWRMERLALSWWLGSGCGAQGLVLNISEPGSLSKKVPPGTVLFSLSVVSDSCDTMDCM